MSLAASSLAIGPAGPLEANVLAALHALCFADAWSAQSMAEVVGAPGAFALLATVESAPEPTPVGFAVARVAADEAELLSIGVAPEMRRRAVGATLLDETLRLVRARGAQRIFLEVAEDNSVARRLYRRRGFAEVGRRPGYYSRPGEAVVAAITLRRRLAIRSWPWRLR